MSWLFFAVLTALCWGFGNFFVKKGLVTLSPLWTAAIGSLLYFVIFLPIAFTQGITLTIAPQFLLLTLIATALYILFYYALAHGTLAITGTVIATYPVVTIFLSVFFLQERLTILQVSMILLILLGGILLQYTGEKTSNKAALRKALLWALLASVAIGVADFFSKLVIDSINLNTYLFLYTFGYIISVVGFWLFDRQGRKLPKTLSRPTIMHTIIGITLMTAGLLFFYFALSIGPASLVTTLSSSYVAVTVLLAFFFLKERISRMQLIGVLLITTGVIFISI